MSINTFFFLLIILFPGVINPFFPFFGRPKQERIVTIMFDPAGDAQHTGRKIDDTFERSVTLIFAQELKESLEKAYPSIQVVLTRNAGETVTSLQNANFANRLNVDLFLSINFYQETSVKPKAYLYNFSYNDDFITQKNELSFCRYDQAHLFNYPTTRQYGLIIKQEMESDPYKALFECIQLNKAPIKPCIGIKSPAIALEAGLHKADDWQLYIDPLTASLKPIIEKLQNQ